MQAGIASPYIYFEEEKEEEKLLKYRSENCKVWASLLDPTNYEAKDVPEEQHTVIQYVPTEEIAEIQKRSSASSSEFQQAVGLFSWSLELLDNAEAPEFLDLASAAEIAEELSKKHHKRPVDAELVEDWESARDAVVAFAAAVCLHRWDWVVERKMVSWCRDLLIESAWTPVPTSPFGYDVSRYRMGHKRSAARALPGFLRKRPNDRLTRAAILRLAVDENPEIRDFLFHALHL